MVKYIKNNDQLLKKEINWIICDSLSEVPTNLSNGLVIVVNDGIYKCTGSTFTKVFESRRKRTQNVGEVKLFYGNTIPTGWLECNGQSFSQSSYPALYTYLGNKTNVPDYRELTMTGTARGNNWWYDRIPNHTHELYNLTHTHDYASHTHGIGYKTQTATGSPTSGTSVPIYQGQSSISTNTTYEDEEVYPGFQPRIREGYINPTVGNAITTDGTPVGNCTRDREIGVRFIICAQE